MKISDYGIIGNCRSSALISKYGSIDWCCLPDFDSASIFARLLDDERGGYFSIGAKGDYAITQRYLVNTNILVTKFVSSSAAFEIIDFMPIYHTFGDEYYNAPEIYRLIRVLKGTPLIRVEYHPMLNYANPTEGYISKYYVKHVTKGGRYESLYLYTDINKELVLNNEFFELNENCYFCISYHEKLVSMDFSRVHLEYQRTKVYWMNWSNRTIKIPKYEKFIIRSSLLLRLLTYEKSGAIIAAPTTSLPESIGETRNWDYRFTWIRDSSMVIKTFLNIGHERSAAKFQRFILNVNNRKQEDIQIMYGIRWEKDLKETILPQFKGYMDSLPVRIGNAAFSQKQNDIYGVLMDTIYTSMLKFPTTLDTTEELWTFVRGLIVLVSRTWGNPDKSIWEIRGADYHFTYSKVMSWVAIDRGVKIAQRLDRGMYVLEWSKLADTIREDIFKNGWDEELGSFVQAYGTKNLDASNLLMEEVGLIEADDPKYISTVLKIRDELYKNGFMFRYVNEDDFGIPTNSFVLCNFWLVNALYKIGRKNEALDVFENILSCANHVGLLSEHIDVETRELMGNFPQAYSHLGLIQSALLLNGAAEEIDEDVFKWLKP
jgi:GH15 family glucan-1,4-alpha-glucosidase